MVPNEMVLDLETQNSFDDVGGPNPRLLKISCVGIYFFKTDTYKSYMEADLPALERELAQCSRLIGFNHLRFDLPVLEQYFPTFELKNLPCLDILEEIRKVAGHRVSLNSVARATLNREKSGHGLEAIKLWREERIDELVKYCLDDVKITKEVYDYGKKHQEIFFTAKDPRFKSRVPVQWHLLHNPEAKQLGLF